MGAGLPVIRHAAGHDSRSTWLDCSTGQRSPGRSAHSSLNGGVQPVSSSDKPIQGDTIHTPNGKQPYPVPRPLRADELPGIIELFRRGAETGWLRQTDRAKGGVHGFGAGDVEQMNVLDAEAVDHRLDEGARLLVLIGDDELGASLRAGFRNTGRDGFLVGDAGDQADLAFQVDEWGHGEVLGSGFVLLHCNSA